MEAQGRPAPRKQAAPRLARPAELKQTPVRKIEAVGRRAAKPVSAAVRRVANGGAAALQAQLQSAYEADGDWKEF